MDTAISFAKNLCLKTKSEDNVQ